jgi:septum site-determining protein MinC
MTRGARDWPSRSWNEGSTVDGQADGEGGAIQIKGTRKGLSITMGQGRWDGLVKELDRRLTQSEAFFRGSEVTVSTGGRDLSLAELQSIARALSVHSIELGMLQTSSRIAAEAAQALGVRLGLPEVASLPTELPVPTEDWSEGTLVRRTLRSGQSIRQPGHVVIVGDVNPGAEVVAGGDVVVWGKLRGMVFAGAMGNEQAIVCALELKPSLLRIGSHVATSPEDKDHRAASPEVASVQDGQIVAKPWTTK